MSSVCFSFALAVSSASIAPFMVAIRLFCCSFAQNAPSWLVIAPIGSAPLSCAAQSVSAKEAALKILVATFLPISIPPIAVIAVTAFDEPSFYGFLQRIWGECFPN